MPLYKILCIAAHYPEYRYIKDLVMQSAKLLLENGSTVRSIQYLGTKDLPQRMRRHKHWHDYGDYWTMYFDSSPRLISQLDERLRNDPRVIRNTVLKLGERLEDIVDERHRTVAHGSPNVESSTHSRSLLSSRSLSSSLYSASRRSF